MNYYLYRTNDQQISMNKYDTHKFIELLGLNLHNPVFGPRQNLGSLGLNHMTPYIFGKLVEILGSSLYFRKGRAHFGASGAKKHHFFGPPQ